MRRLGLAFSLALLLLPRPSSAEVIIQFFETRWDEIYQRLPELADIGYESIWTPPPGKSPIGGPFPFAYGGNVGYNSFDRFDLGDMPQRGNWETRYGSRTSLRNMVDNAHQCGVKIYPDIVFNHTGNGPDYRTYPGMVPQDFHVWTDASQPGGFKRAPRMGVWTPDNGYGGTLNQELVSLMDVVLEFDGRFQGANSPNYVADPTPFVRHPGDYDKYPYNPSGTLPAENSREFMVRWINWLGYAMDYDGVRLDAPKHVAKEFFGLPNQALDTRDKTFIYNIQKNFNERRGYTDTAAPFDDMYTNDIRRDDAIVFSEFFIGSIGDVDYWRNPADRNWGIQTRYLNFPLKSGMMASAFSGGNLAALASMGVSFDAGEAVNFVQSHDEAPLSKLELSYAYILTHIGVPVVYFTGNNLKDSEIGRQPGKNTWLNKGYDGALGDYAMGSIPNLIYIHNQFCRAKEYTRWSEGDFFAYERYDDLNSSGAPNSGEGLILIALNDSGSDQTRGGIQTSFTAGTKLKDYSGKNPDTVTVASDGTVSIRVPGSGGQGWVCYAPFNAEAPTGVDPLQFSGTGVTTMPWVIPGGRDASSKSRTLVRLTGDTAIIDIYYSNTNPQQNGETVDNVLLKWGKGADINGNGSIDFNGKDIVTGGFEATTKIADGHYRVTANIANIPEGLHNIQARVFNGRSGKPALFQTFSETVYVDRHGPDLEFLNLTAGDTLEGARVVTINNPDHTLYNLTYTIDGGAAQQADMVIKSKWRISLDGLTSGSHSLVLNATEFDYGATRALINTSTLTRAFTVDTAGQAISINHSAGATITEPFFTTIVTVPAGQGITAADIKLYWDGYEQQTLTENPAGSGKFESTFTGRYVQGGVQKLFTGAFVNGPHFFEAVVTKSGTENRVARKVYFNLYNQMMQDSDGDGIPDDIELSAFLNGTNPGPDQNWPGDNSQDLIPNYGETWTRMNPMNADTDYVNSWDGDVDSDGDGVSNLQEVIRSYRLTGNPYSYNIYSASSTPPSAAVSVATATLGTSGGQRVMNFTYRPNEGPLTGQSSVRITVTPTGAGSAQTITMTAGTAGDFSTTYTIPTGATSVSYSFSNATGSVTDTTSASSWTASTVVGFTMDGVFDSAGFKVVDNGMVIYAAVRGTKLYTATWSTMGGGNDHFIFITDQFGNPRNHPWGKAGQIYFDSTTKPWLAANPTTAYPNNFGASGRSYLGAGGAALEGELDLVQVFGSVPSKIYIAVGAYARADGSSLSSQAPAAWDADNNIQITEFQALNPDSIRDENLDGVFDVGVPYMSTIVNGNETDGNYGLRRFYLDELAKDEGEITVKFKPNLATGTLLFSPEVYTNLNRRDFAVLEESPASVTTTSSDTYFRAYTMTGPDGSGYYSKTLKVNRCGAYRLQVRYKISSVNNGEYLYYTDHALRRDCAIVVSPKKALNLTMYEVNPLIVEAKDTTKAGRSTLLDLVNDPALPGESGGYDGRPDAVNRGHFSALGVNMLWLQPIHPTGVEGRDTNPETSAPFDPGSPYAVRDYWSINPVLGRAETAASALTEFQTFVSRLDSWGVGVMMDGTFNHSAPDCIMGQGAVDLSLPYSADAKIRDANYQWYAKEGFPGQPAGSISEIAIAPDRNDFGNWTDTREFFFGSYDALVKAKGTYDGTAKTYADNANRNEFLLERDEFAGHTPNTRQLWQYFAYYPTYWLEKTGHPKGTPKSESYKGIDGLRCDFAQGLPSLFWEYCINKTRSVKWDFVFMAESLDGFREVGGSKRHGVGYRSARTFDVLNENIIFYWRDNFFGYPANGGAGTPATPSTSATFTKFDDRRQAYDSVTILNAMVSHDEVLPHNDPYRVLYAYAEVAAIDGTPMILYGQEGGLENSKTGYAASETNFGTINANRNFGKYETNFGKVIPNFKVWNDMTNLWANRDWTVQDLYGRINRARLSSPALRSPNVYFLSTTNGGFSSNLFAVAKYQQGNLTAGQQEVVLAFVNNNPNASNAAVFTLNATNSSGANWFGIESGKSYNVRDLLSTNTSSTNYVWGTAKTGTEILSGGLYVGLPYEGRQAHYLKLVEINSSALDTDGDGLTNDTDPDDDNDGIPDVYEIANGMNPLVATGADGPNADNDADGMTNYQEFLAGTKANDRTSAMGIASLNPNSGQSVTLTWNSIPGTLYKVRYSQDLLTWTDFPGGLITAEATTSSVQAVPPQGQTYNKLFFKVDLVP